MNIHSDFEEFLRLLNAESTEFVIVGGYAVAFHGYVRATDDLDVFFRNSPDNVAAIRRALEAFGMPTTEENATAFSEPENIIRMGIAPFRIEMMNSISGLTFDDVWAHRVAGTFGEVPVTFISLDDLLKNKREASRPKDLSDVDELGGNRSA